jgi:hypothetical protein
VRFPESASLTDATQNRPGLDEDAPDDPAGLTSASPDNGQEAEAIRRDEPIPETAWNGTSENFIQSTP